MDGSRFIHAADYFLFQKFGKIAFHPTASRWVEIKNILIMNIEVLNPSFYGAELCLIRPNYRIDIFYIFLANSNFRIFNFHDNLVQFITAVNSNLFERFKGMPVKILGSRGPLLKIIHCGQKRGYDRVAIVWSSSGYRA